MTYEEVILKNQFWGFKFKHKIDKKKSKFALKTVLNEESGKLKNYLKK